MARDKRLFLADTENPVDRPQDKWEIINMSTEQPKTAGNEAIASPDSCPRCGRLQKS